MHYYRTYHRQNGTWQPGEVAHFIQMAWYFSTPDPDGALARQGNQEVTIIGVNTENQAYAAFVRGLSLDGRFDGNLLLSYWVRFADGLVACILESELFESKDFLLNPPAGPL